MCSASITMDTQECSSYWIKRTGKVALESGWVVHTTSDGWCMGLNSSNQIVVSMRSLQTNDTKTISLHELLHDNREIKLTVLLDERLWPEHAAIWRGALEPLPLTVVDNTRPLKRDAPVPPTRKVLTRIQCDKCACSIDSDYTDGGATFTSPFNHLLAIWLCTRCNVDPEAARACVRNSHGAWKLIGPESIKLG